MVTRLSMERFELLGRWQETEEFRKVAGLKSAWATSEGHVIGGVYFMVEHDVFVYTLLTKDNAGRYRRFFTSTPKLSAREAESSINSDLGIIESDEKPAPALEAAPGGVDLFAAGLATKYNPKYVNLRDSANTSAKREVMTEIARWFDDLDGNFVKDFQTTGFDARVWELYLFTSFNELGFTIDNSNPVPGFRLSRGGQKVFVEAVTANPSDGKQFDIAGGPPPPPEDFAYYIEHAMPQKFGSPLRSKVKKEYWKGEDIGAHPFVLALADFHAPASMTWSQTALSFYLY